MRRVTSEDPCIVVARIKVDGCMTHGEEYVGPHESAEKLEWCRLCLDPDIIYMWWVGGRGWAPSLPPPAQAEHLVVEVIYSMRHSAVTAATPSKLCSAPWPAGLAETPIATSISTKTRALTVGTSSRRHGTPVWTTSASVANPHPCG